MSDIKPNVTLLNYSSKPLESLYLAYRVCYSDEKPEDIQIPEKDKLLKFIERRLETGHTSPLEQIWFEFLISGVSRSFSHQFVRHRMGTSFEQQSQRYVEGFKYITPKSIQKDLAASNVYHSAMKNIKDLYSVLLAYDIPKEDARFVLPNAATTNLKAVINFQAFLHMADLRLCTLAQWEFRKVVALMRGQIRKVVPDLGRYIQPKCGDKRLGYCDESISAYRKCPLSKVRPHKSTILN